MLTAKKKMSERTPTRRGESALDGLLKRIRGTDEFPTISKYVIDINQKLSLNPESSNATDLANVILKDHALTSKLLKMVNSAFYGLVAGNVSTVTRAVVVLGYENVRLATISLALFEHFKSKSGSNHLKEVVVGSFWSGMMARELASMEGCVDSEAVFVCAMMSHLGKLVMIYYLPDEYHKICALIDDKGVSESKATRSVCGVTYDELGMAVARQWNFPAQIVDAMQPLAKNELQDKKNPPKRFRAVSGFVRELCDTIHGGRLVADTKPLQQLLERYRPHITISKKQLKALIKDSVENVHQHARALNLDSAQSIFLDRLSAIYDPERRSLSSRKSHEATNQTSRSYHFADENQLNVGESNPKMHNSKDIIMEGIQELSQVMMTDYDVDAIAVMSLEILYSALEFQRTLMFIQDGITQKMSVRFGYGRNCQQLIKTVNFRLGSSTDLFSLSIQIGKDLIVADSYDGKMNHLIPAWYREKIDAPSFIFLPITFQKVCIGALYADRETKGLPVSESEHRYIGMLRNQIVLSIKYRQNT